MLGFGNENSRNWHYEVAKWPRDVWFEGGFELLVDRIKLFEEQRQEALEKETARLREENENLRALSQVLLGGIVVACMYAGIKGLIEGNHR